MKKLSLMMLFAAGYLFPFSQIEVDRSIQLTGPDGERNVTNLEIPVNDTDAASKEYVDGAVAATGSSSPTQVSNESSSSYSNLGDALRYCSTLTEGGNSDWYMPTFEEITFLLSKGGISISDNASPNSIWTRSKLPNNVGNSSSSYVQSVIYFRMSTGESSFAIASSATHYVRCVR
ncbi:MAG: DUF1566 domain-containing protein [Crocinitomicaceae bacterium]|nr:DUF1566 domain-containing protein [Crocinitomicaceae bacterium]